MNVAQAFGLRKALILQQIHYWILINKNADERKGVRHHFKKSRWWMWNTYEQWQEEFGNLFAKRTLRKDLNDLKDQGIIFAEKLSDSPRDQTLWYSINYKKLEQAVEDHIPKTNPRQSGQLDVASHAVTCGKPCRDTWQDMPHDPYTEITTESTSESKQVAKTKADDKPSRDNVTTLPPASQVTAGASDINSELYQLFEDYRSPIAPVETMRLISTLSMKGLSHSEMKEFITEKLTAWGTRYTTRKQLQMLCQDAKDWKKQKTSNRKTYKPDGTRDDFFDNWEDDYLKEQSN